jgi:hypothetical protein
MLNFEIFEKEPKDYDRQKMLHLIKIASFITSHESLYLEERVDFLKQKLPLSEIFQTLGIMFMDEVKNGKVKVPKRPHATTIKFDRYYLEKGIELIIDYLLCSGNKVELKYDQKENAVHIVHNKKIQAEIPKEELHEYLTTTSLNSKLIELVTGIKILEKHGKLVFEPKKVKIYF